MRPTMLALVLVFVASSVGVRPADASEMPRSERPPRVLFIGNSYTRFNDLPNVVRRIADSVAGGPRFRVWSVSHPGWDLSRHWRSRATRRVLAHGGYTHVVLQGHSLSAVGVGRGFDEPVRLFDGEIERIGARTVLYETWARRPGSGIYRRLDEASSALAMQARITSLYSDAASAIGADVAPVGRAFLTANGRIDPRVLYRPDGSHPTIPGTYLAALVMYATIAHIDPRRATYRPVEVARDTAPELRQIAWEAYAGDGQPIALTPAAPADPR